MATFVVVHGAWQGGWCWERVEPLLRDAGHRVATPTLTGLGDRAHLVSPLVGLDTHVDDVVRCIDLFRTDDHVVLVGHSYGGQVVAGVASRRPQLVRQVVYLDAFVPADGERAIDLQPADIAHHYRLSVAERGFGWLIPPRALKVLGVTDPDDVAWLAPRLVPPSVQDVHRPSTRVSGIARDPLGVRGVHRLGARLPAQRRARRRPRLAGA